MKPSKSAILSRLYSKVAILKTRMTLYDNEAMQGYEDARYIPCKTWAALHWNTLNTESEQYLNELEAELDSRIIDLLLEDTLKPCKVCNTGMGRIVRTEHEQTYVVCDGLHCEPRPIISGTTIEEAMLKWGVKEIMDDHQQ